MCTMEPLAYAKHLQCAVLRNCTCPRSTICLSSFEDKVRPFKHSGTHTNPSLKVSNQHIMKAIYNSPINQY